MERGIELLNQDKRRGVIISSGEEHYRNRKLWYFFQEVHAQDFVPHESAGKLHIRPGETPDAVCNGNFGCVQQDRYYCCHTERVHHTPVAGKPPALDKLAVF